MNIIEHELRLMIAKEKERSTRVFVELSETNRMLNAAKKTICEQTGEIAELNNINEFNEKQMNRATDEIDRLNVIVDYLEYARNRVAKYAEDGQ